MTDVPAAGGVLRVDKPEGPTSHDVVAVARRVLGIRKIGHTGTLDPFASGLLLLCVGEATRLSPFLTGADKEYEATARLGVRTDSHDRDGAVVGTSEGWRGLDRGEVTRALERFVGVQAQRPPGLSAKKVAGEAAHRRVRRGEEVELAPVEVTVHELELTGFEPPDVTFRVVCSSGTYIRALARDLGEALGVGAHLSRLRRTRVGRHRVEGAVRGTFDGAIPDGAWLTPLEALAGWPRAAVTADQARRLGHGQRVPLDAGALEGSGDGLVAVHLGGELVAVCQVGDGGLKPRRVFPAGLAGAVP